MGARRGFSTPLPLLFFAAPPHNSRMKESEDIAALRLKLHEIQVEHRDLDDIIERLLLTPPHDDLMLRRLKKRKLQLKDRIALLERMIEPDESA